jgi:diadenosine tetraphosphate (Ap4A) HIT family hydrolase
MTATPSFDVPQCPFCETTGAVLRHAQCYARYDLNPVTRGHMLIIPLRHEADFFRTTVAERSAMLALLDDARSLLEREIHPDGFNVGVNVGAAAGQTIGHVHLHLIPRFHGDVEQPRGGVRGVIPSRQNY